MKFLLDAQLPRRLAKIFSQSGHEVLHTLDLPQGNRTTDSEIISYADRGGYVVVTKDSDFIDSFYLKAVPARLLLISTGNIGNSDLESLLASHLAAIAEALNSNAFVEINARHLTIHS